MSEWGIIRYIERMIEIFYFGRILNVEEDTRLVTPVEDNLHVRQDARNL